MSQLEGRNPVLEALRTNAEINKILIQRNAGGSMRQIFELAKEEVLPAQTGSDRVQGTTCQR